MSDRELLELAAKAARIPGEWEQRLTGAGLAVVGECKPVWNPLHDRSQAMGLCAALNLDIRFVVEPDGAAVHCFGNYDDYPAKYGMAPALELLGAAPESAVCRAIVRAAAEIGKAMP